MSPSTTSIAAVKSSQLRQQIYYSLDNELLDNASLLAGRLLAHEPRSRDAAHLLALTHLRMRRYNAAYEFSLKYGAKGDHLGCAYVFAQACLQLDRLADGITALEKARGTWNGKNEWHKHSETSRRHVPDAPAVLTLLAKLYQANGEARKAGDCYIEAHKLNPFVWDAFEGLCKISADLRVENMFKLPAGMATASEYGTGETQIYVDEDSRRPLATQPNYGQAALPHDDVFTSRGEDQDHMRGQTSLTNGLRPPPSEWDTPTTAGGPFDDDVLMAENLDDTFNEPPVAPSRRMRAGQHVEISDRPRPPQLRGQSEASDDPTQAPRKPVAGAQKRTISGAASHTSSTTDSAQPRRSNRLFTQSTTTRTTRSSADTSASIAGRTDRTARTAKAATGTKGRSGAVVGRVVSGNRKIMPPEEKDKEKRNTSRASERSAIAPNVPSVTSAIAVAQKHAFAPSKTKAAEEEEAMTGLLNNLRQLAVGCYAISRFQLPEAIQVFRSLPAAQRETPWVLAQLGKAYYEAAEYKSAEDCYARLVKIQPSRIEDMEIYSTILWHLKKEASLSWLCRVLRDSHFDVPQTWVAVGNAFSLSREHDQAISAFKRATQLDEKFAYAWTLMGHEYMANEAFDAALEAFRRAVAIDKRGYGGWYGLGKCYQALGKLEDAERHYRIAHHINPSNATLLVCIGVVLERLRNKPAALANYSKALELAPTSALARFKRARVLMHMHEFNSALEELQILHDQAPDEANVHFLLGKCYKGLRERGEALRAFTTALNLDAKAQPFIKEAIDLLNEDDEDSDED